jgi:hypothetical protein
MIHDVFISHSTKDKRTADAVCGILEKNDLVCWIAPRNIRSGESWPEAITKAVSESALMLLVFSKNANASKDVANELILAMEKKIPVIPLRIDSAKPAGVLQYYLAGAHWHEAANPPTEIQLIKISTIIKQLVLDLKVDFTSPVDGEERSKDDGATAAFGKAKYYRLIANALKYFIIIALAFMGLVYYYNQNWRTKFTLDPGQVRPIGFPVSTYTDRDQAPVEISEQLNIKAGNIINRGLAAEQDGSVYFINSDDGNKLYVIRSGESRQSKLNDDHSAYLNVCGDWIYYVNRSQNNQIYKMRTDGSGDDKLLTDHAEYLYCYDGWLYYINYAHLGRIYKIRIDGTDRSRLTMDNAEFLFLDNNWLYFKNHNHAGRIYKVRHDGSDSSQVNKEYVKHINVQGDWIYYVNGDDNDRIYKIMSDGSNKTRISSSSARFINFYDDWLYYSNNDDGGTIYRMRPDGTDNTRLNDQSSGYINIILNWLYYVERDNNDRIQRINLEKF